VNNVCLWRCAAPRGEMGREVGSLEAFINATRGEFKVDGVYSRYSEQGWASTRLYLTIDDSELSSQIQEKIRKGLPQSARARIGLGWPGSSGNQNQGVSFSLIGDSSQTLEELAADIVPLLNRNEKLRDVRVDTGDANTELSVRVDRERAAAYGFSAQQVAEYVGMALRGSSLRDFHRDNVEIPVNVRFAGAEHYGVE